MPDEGPSGVISLPEAQPATAVHSDPTASPKLNDVAPTRPRRSRRRLLRWLLRSGIALILLIAIGIAIAFLLARTPPAWWQAIDPAAKPVQEAAQRVENGAATQITRIRASDPGTGDSKPWTIKLSAADANAWLAARLRPWLESQDGTAFKWPADLERIEVDFNAGRINLGARVRSPGHERPDILTASLLPQFRSDGGLWLPAKSVSIGRLSMPVSWMITDSALRRASGSAAKLAPGQPQRPAVPDSLTSLPQTRDLLAALADQRPAMQSPIIKIGDGRRVRILKLDPRDGALYITCQTLPSEPSGASRRIHAAEPQRRPVPAASPSATATLP